MAGRKRKRVISPLTETLYRDRLRLAYGKESPPLGSPVVDLASWSVPMRAQLRAALGRYAEERLSDLPEDPWAPKRAIQPPTDNELNAYEARADEYPPAIRAMLLLPMKFGLRAAELLNLTRRSVERAADGADLLVMRKGGRERLLECESVRPLLDDMLLVEWSFAWQLLSRSTERAAYRKLHRLVRELGGANLRPHKLRHGFATRMMQAGASLPQIQFALDHSSPEVTSRYVHPESRDLKNFLPPTKRKGEK